MSGKILGFREGKFSFGFIKVYEKCFERIHQDYIKFGIAYKSFLKQKGMWGREKLEWKEKLIIGESIE
jgi:hypothetical protein